MAMPTALKTKRNKAFFSTAEKNEILKKVEAVKGDFDKLFEHITDRTLVQMFMLEKLSFKLRGPSAGSQIVTVLKQEQELLTAAMKIRSEALAERDKRAAAEQADGDNTGPEEDLDTDSGDGPELDTEDIEALVPGARELLAGQMPVQQRADMEDPG